MQNNESERFGTLRLDLTDKLAGAGARRVGGSNLDSEYMKSVLRSTGVLDRRRGGRGSDRALDSCGFLDSGRVVGRPEHVRAATPQQNCGIFNDVNVGEPHLPSYICKDAAPTPSPRPLNWRRLESPASPSCALESGSCDRVDCATYQFSEGCTAKSITALHRTAQRHGVERKRQSVPADQRYRRRSRIRVSSTRSCKSGRCIDNKLKWVAGYFFTI